MCAKKFLCATFYQDSSVYGKLCMKYVQTHFLKEMFCALQVFMFALVSRLRENIGSHPVSYNLQLPPVLPAHLPSRAFHHSANPSTRSSSCLALSRPPVTSHLTFSKRAISVTAPRLWNDLPPDLAPFLYLHHHHSKS